MSEDQYAYFSINSQQKGYQIERRDRKQCQHSNLSYRKARIRGLPHIKNKQIFKDQEFTIDIEHFNESQDRAEPQYHLRRIYQIYDSTEQFNIFDQKWFKPTHYTNIGQDQVLPTFLSEFIIIDKEQIQTRFFTKTINKLGYYQYFVRRNGEYHVEYMDDYIPVEGKKRLPIWGINIKEPWKLLLMKAWLKEKKSIEAVLKAKPYEFIDAFGLPGYRALSIKKEIISLQLSKLPESVKEVKEKKIHFNEEGFITVGKTRNSDRVKQLGLRKNQAGYKIVPLKESNFNAVGQSLLKSAIKHEQVVYKIQSELPVYWAGEFSLLGNQLKKYYKPQIHDLNMQKEFLITYDEISEVFSKFYTAPTYHHKYGYDSVAEESIFIEIQDYQNQMNPYYFFKLEISKAGCFNLNIDLPLASGKDLKNDHKSVRYSSIKYFLTKQDPTKSYHQALQDKNIKTGFQFYDGQYVKGYHKSLNRFIDIKEGTYFVYVKLQNYEVKANHFSINLITNAKIEKFERIDLTSEEESYIISKTFYSQSKSGLRGYLYSGSKDMIVYLSNKFDQFGFGVIAIYLHEKVKDYMLAMKVHLNELKKHNLTICKQAHEKTGDIDYDVPIQFIAKPGRPAIIVLEKQRRQKSQTEKFPPPNTIDFFEIAL